MTSPAEQFLQATEALIAAACAVERLKNGDSERAFSESLVALTKARKRYVELASAFVAGWVTPEDGT